MKSGSHFVAAAVLASTFALSNVAFAQATGTGFAVDRFPLSERGSEWYTNESLDLRGDKRFAAGLVVEGSFRPLALYNPDGSVDTDIIKHQVFTHLGGSLIMWDRVRFGLDVPIAVYQSGQAGVLPSTGLTYNPPDSPAFGDLRVGGDVRLFGKYGDSVTGAIGAQIFLPTGSRDNYTSDGTVRVLPRAMLAGDVGPIAYAAHLSVQIRPHDDNFGGGPLGSELLFGASAGIRAVDKKLLIGPEIFGSTAFNDAFSRQGTPLEGILGAHYHAGDVMIGAGGGGGLTRGFGAPTARWLVSIEYAPGIKEEAPPPPPPEEGPKDRDKDGVLDDDDACVDVPGIKTDDPKTNGCPSDRDKDKILDDDDACPDEPGVKTKDPKTNGCPPDKDGDGVLDKDDACVDVPGLKTSDPKTNGCPDPDRDKDGVLNEQDACPDEPGKPDKDPKKNGCPKAFIKDGQIKILDQVKFATGSAQIVKGKDSEDILNAVLKVLTDHPEVKKVRVEGHTDNRGSATMNKKLSADRAASVVKWLVAHKIEKDRLSSAGFGPDRPLESNDTDDGRKANRRVEFHIESETPAADKP